MTRIIQLQSGEPKDRDSSRVSTTSSAAVALRSLQEPRTTHATRLEAIQHSLRTMIANTSDLISDIPGGQKSTVIEANTTD